jgi:hypothetical protein
MSLYILFHITKHLQFLVSYFSKVRVFIFYLLSSLFVSIAATCKTRSRKIKGWIKYFSVNAINILGKNKYSKGQVVLFLDQYYEPFAAE